MEKLRRIPDSILKQMQQKDLEMLKYFKAFCDEHSLRFFLCGGCCIGAVRCGGFIPWDDDVDVFMPRPDYEKLKQLWVDSERYSIQFPSEKLYTRNQFVTIHDNETTFIKSYQADLDINHGLALDVIPLDGCPSGLARKFQKFWALIYSLFVIEKAPENHGSAVKALGRIALALAPGHKLKTKIWKFAERRMSKYDFDSAEKITELCSGPRYMQNEYPARCFSSALQWDFCKEKMPLPFDFDTYLTMAFGDYMTLPDESERACHHDFLRIDMNRSYRLPPAPMPEEDLKKLKEISLKILLFFKDYCDAHSLRFFLCGGALIGAVRHGGFIPWDDDIDVFMPRPDYEKLKEIWVDSEKYSYVRTTKDHYTRLMHACINDNETTYIKERQADLDTKHGVRLEIIPLDGCPSGIARKFQKMWALIYQIYNVGEPPTSKGKFFNIIGKIMLLPTRSPKSRARIWQLAERKMSKYDFDSTDKTTELVTRWQYMVNEYPHECFAGSTEVEFEGYKMPAPADYDTYLRMAFGNYMELPPKEEQVPKHDAVFYDLTQNQHN
jgi:lipopolysaccharide cholinephosphotransferase